MIEFIDFKWYMLRTEVETAPPHRGHLSLIIDVFEILANPDVV